MSLPKSYQKNSRTAKELAKEMDKFSQKSQSQISQGGDKDQKSVKQVEQITTSSPLDKFTKNVKNVTDKNKIIGMMKPPLQQQGSQPQKAADQLSTTTQAAQAASGSHATLALYKFKNFRKQHGEEKYILDTHSFTSVQTYIDSLKMNEAEAAEKSLDLFVFNDREFDSTQNGIKLIHRDNQKPMSKELANLVDNISYVRALYICEEPYKHIFYPTLQEERHHEEDEPIKPPYFTQNFIQGYLNSAHFLNALCLVASNRELFDRMCYLEDEQSLQENHQYGIYTFRFYKNKTQKFSVIIDDKIPCATLSNGKPVPCFSRCFDSNSLWISLIEKAYAKLNGCYTNLENLSLREIINDLTGLEPEIIPLVDKEYINTSNLLPFLNIFTSNKSVVGAMRIGQLNGKGGVWNKSLENRMYIIKAVNFTDKKIIVQNCWYNTGLLNGKRYFESQKEIDDEREYEITSEEFYQLFNTLVILKDFTDEYRGVRFDVTLSPSYGMPNANNVSWINNPQFVFDYSDKEESNFVFRISELRGIESTNFINVGFALFSLSEKERQVKQVNFQNMLLNLKSGDRGDCDEKFAGGMIKLQKGKYAIIPYSNLKGIDSIYLNLEVFYTCRESVIKFQEKSERILEQCIGEPEESQPRRLRDKVKKERIPTYNIQTSAAQQNYEVLIPGQAKFFIVSSISQLQQFLKNPENRKYQNLIKKLSISSVGIQDPLLENFQDTLLNEMLLGIQEQQEEQKSERENQRDQNVADQLKYEMEGTYDFNYYGLQDQGLEAVVRVLVAQKNVLEVKLAGNDITIYLCLFKKIKSVKELLIYVMNLRNLIISSYNHQTLVIILFKRKVLNLFSFFYKEYPDQNQLILKEISKLLKYLQFISNIAIQKKKPFD